MTILAVAGEIAMIGWILFFGWFAVISLREKEKRAFLRSAFCCLSLILSGLLFFLSPFPFQRILFSGLAVFSMIFFCSMFFTSSPKKGIEIFGNQAQVDERDVIFARFDLEKGTEHYKAYYDNRRDLASIDREIRQMPDLFSESHNIKDPGLFALAAAEFDFLEHQLTWVDGKTNEPKAKLSVEGNTRLVKQAVQYLGSDLCGIAPLNKSYVYSHTGRGPDPYGQEIVLDHKFAILFAVEMDTAMVSAAPKAPVVAETGKQYVEAAKISIILADFIRRMGYPARAHVAGSNYQAILPPMAWEAGLGELGRLGTLITTKFGPRARLGLVTTSLPLKTDRPKVLGIQDFCEKCRKCAVNCPAQAIPHGKKEKENGVLKWVLKREECYRYWRKAGTDCAVCMYVCPYSKPDNMFHNLIRLAAAHSSVAQSLSVWGDDVFYGKKPPRKKSPFTKGPSR